MRGQPLNIWISGFRKPRCSRGTFSIFKGELYTSTSTSYEESHSFVGVIVPLRILDHQPESVTFIDIP